MKHPFKTHIITALLLASCSTQQQKEAPAAYTEMKKSAWLIGSWENRSQEGNAYESWTKENDSVYTGQSCFVIGTDTVSSESIRIEQRGEELFYIPTVKEQNNGRPVSFTMTASAENELIFENPGHDFPQKITYLKITDDSLVAEISGNLEGKASAQRFPLKRVK
jgi:hypothetical protein